MLVILSKCHCLHGKKIGIWNLVSLCVHIESNCIQISKLWQFLRLSTEIIFFWTKLIFNLVRLRTFFQFQNNDLSKVCSLNNSTATSPGQGTSTRQQWTFIRFSSHVYRFNMEHAYTRFSIYLKVYGTIILYYDYLVYFIIESYWNIIL